MDGVYKVENICIQTLGLIYKKGYFVISIS